jgi:hypothetical protein
MSLGSEFHRRHCFDLGISTAAFSEVVSIHRNRLGSYLNGVGQLSGTEVMKIEDTLKDLDRLVQIAAPFTPELNNVAKTKELLLQLHGGGFDDRIQKEQP